MRQCLCIHADTLYTYGQKHSKTLNLLQILIKVFSNASFSRQLTNKINGSLTLIFLSDLKYKLLAMHVLINIIFIGAVHNLFQKFVFL